MLSTSTKMATAQDHLSDTLIRSLAPSVFAKNPMPGVSDRYQFVPTIEVIRTMRDAGYEVVKASQSVSKTNEGRLYTRHQVRMQHRDYLKNWDARKVGDVIPEAILSNSHNRTSAFALDAGLFRLWCANGMATSCGSFSSFRVLHSDKQLHAHIIEGTSLIREVTETKVLPQIEAMTKRELTKAEEQEFALAATFLKFGKPMPAEVEFFLQCRREQDAGRSLWSVLNRCQENAVKAGYTTRDAAGRSITRKGIESVDKDIDFNLAIWRLGAEVLGN